MREPLVWIRQPNGDYQSDDGDYVIKWRYYGQTGKSWYVWYRGRELPLTMWSRLKDAKEQAQKHANGDLKVNKA
jgi:hypothetical protein